MRQDLTEIEDSVRHALDVTLRGCEELLPQPEWVGKLQRSQRTGQPLRIKLGLDPTAPDIHLGHTVVLNKMRQLLYLGGATASGVIVGARVPITVVTHRHDSANAYLASAVLAKRLALHHRLVRP